MTTLKDDKEYQVIADEFRTVEMNKEYYSKRLSTKRMYLRGLDIFLALFAAGSAVLSFSLWNVNVYGFQVGQIAFGALSGLAVVFGIAKPYLKLEDEIERTSGIQATYASLSSLLYDIVTDIKTRATTSTESKAAYKTLRQVRNTLSTNEDKPANTHLVEKSQHIVNRRYPPDWFFK